jgi:hypothetical protein
MLDSSGPVPNIVSIFTPPVASKTLLHVFLVLAFVPQPIRVNVNAVPVHQTILPVPKVLFAIGPNIIPQPVDHII